MNCIRAKGNARPNGSWDVLQVFIESGHTGEESREVQAQDEAKPLLTFAYPSSWDGALVAALSVFLDRVG